MISAMDGKLTPTAEEARSIAVTAVDRIYEALKQRLPPDMTMARQWAEIGYAANHGQPVISWVVLEARLKARSQRIYETHREESPT